MIFFRVHELSLVAFFTMRSFNEDAEAFLSIKFEWIINNEQNKSIQHNYLTNLHV